jgi:hypothetical protein
LTAAKEYNRKHIGAQDSTRRAEASQVEGYKDMIEPHLQPTEAPCQTNCLKVVADTEIDRGDHETASWVSLEEYQRLQDALITCESGNQSLQSENASLRENLRALTDEMKMLHTVTDNWKWYTKEMETLKTRLKSLEAEAMSRVERFQPTFDEKIVGDFTFLDQKVKALISFLTKQKTSLVPQEWSKRASTLMRRDCAEESPRLLDYAISDTRKKVLRAIVWKLLEQELFACPWNSFGSSLAAPIGASYRLLWEEPGTRRPSASTRLR